MTRKEAERLINAYEQSKMLKMSKQMFLDLFCEEDYDYE
jgi:hypothetical protein